jgi:hypothetical protein
VQSVQVKFYPVFVRDGSAWGVDFVGVARLRLLWQQRNQYYMVKQSLSRANFGWVKNPVNTAFSGKMGCACGRDKEPV